MSSAGGMLPGASNATLDPELVFQNPPARTFAFTDVSLAPVNQQGLATTSVPFQLAPFLAQINVNYTRNTPLQDAFLSSPNIGWLKGRIEQLLTKATEIPTVVPLDEQFMQDMLQQAMTSSGIPSTPEGLAYMNRVFVEKQLELQYYSLRHQKLYKRYYIDQDRMRNMPYGEYVGAQGITVSPSGYQLSHPFAHARDEYLKATANIVPAADNAPRLPMGSPPTSTQLQFKDAPIGPPATEYCMMGGTTPYGIGWAPTASGQKHPVNECPGPRLHSISTYVGN